MATMTRSKSQLIRGFLPGQTFQHPERDHRNVSWLTPSRAEVNAGPASWRASKRARPVAGWSTETDSPVNRAPGFLRPVLDLSDEYALLEPDGEVFYNVWPLRPLHEPRCLKVAIFDDPASGGSRQSDPERCDRCGWAREQFQYMVVHTCGQDAPMPVPRSKQRRPRQSARLHSFICRTPGRSRPSTWRCRHDTCNGRRSRVCVSDLADAGAADTST